MDQVLQVVVLVFVAAGAVLTLFHKLRLPVIVGLLITGVIIGPFGLGVLSNRDQIKLLADMGIILLMFSIGLDFTRERLQALLRASRLGVMQMAICIVVTMLATRWFATGWAQALFLGFLVSHTSSTLMLKLFIDRGEFHTPPVRLGLGISITQDLSVVPMLLLVPMLSKGEWDGTGFALDLLRAALTLGVAMLLARYVVPYWMHHVMRTRSRELFLIFLAVVSLGTAWATMAVGLPDTLGAFLAGLAIANTQYSDQTLAEVVPFRDLLVSLFFIATGMLLDVSQIGRFALLALGVVPLVIVLKYFSGFIPAMVRGNTLRVSVTVGLAMAQIGEFSFVLVHEGYANALIGDDLFQFFVLVAIITMLLNPFLVATSPVVTRWFGKVPWLHRMEGTSQPEQQTPAMTNHVVICGYGLNGRNLARALQSLGVPYVALELNPDAVREAQARGESVYFGDATRAEILRSLNIKEARVYVVAISDVLATRQTVKIARSENPDIHIIVRTKNLSEFETLRVRGADEVVAEEFETSLEILARTLTRYNVARMRIEQAIQDLRGNAYKTLRGPSPLPPRQEILGQLLPAIQLETVVVTPGSRAAGRTLGELNLRARTGATILAVQRGGKLEPVPPPTFTIQTDDVLIVTGTPQQILDTMRLIDEAPTES